MSPAPVAMVWHMASAAVALPKFAEWSVDVTNTVLKPPVGTRAALLDRGALPRLRGGDRRRRDCVRTLAAPRLVHRRPALREVLGFRQQEPGGRPADRHLAPVEGSLALVFRLRIGRCEC